MKWRYYITQCWHNSTVERLLLMAEERRSFLDPGEFQPLALLSRDGIWYRLVLEEPMPMIKYPDIRSGMDNGEITEQAAMMILYECREVPTNPPYLVGMDDPLNDHEAVLKFYKSSGLMNLFWGKSLSPDEFLGICVFIMLAGAVFAGFAS